MARPLLFSIAAAALLLTATAALADGHRNHGQYNRGDIGCACHSSDRDADYDADDGFDEDEQYSEDRHHSVRGGYRHDVVEYQEARGEQEGWVERRRDGEDSYRHRGGRHVVADDSDEGDYNGADDYRGGHSNAYNTRYDERYESGDRSSDRTDYDRPHHARQTRGGSCDPVRASRDYDFGRRLSAPFCNGGSNAVVINDSSFTTGGVGAIPSGSWGGGGGGFVFVGGAASGSSSARASATASARVSTSVSVGVRVGGGGRGHGGYGGGHGGGGGGCGGGCH